MKITKVRAKKTSDTKKEKKNTPTSFNTTKATDRKLIAHLRGPLLDILTTLFVGYQRQ